MNHMLPTLNRRAFVIGTAAVGTTTPSLFALRDRKWVRVRSPA
jgi:hypothetical protein